MAKNKNLNQAKTAKNDEFYTQITDIEKELKHYKHHFKDKTIFCNCDDPKQSNFWKYFHLNFNYFGLKKLIATHYHETEPTYKIEYTGEDDNDYEIGVVTSLETNGDFRSPECIELLKEADIIVTNPPFSLFREYLSQLVKYDKKFIIIGSKNAITYKEFFPLLKDNEVWIGYNSPIEFSTPDGITTKLNGLTRWFTNLDISKCHEKLILWKNYTPEKYPKYDNYDAINVDRVADIPVDYDGVMGVPITFLDKFCPEQFEILGYAGGIGWDENNDAKTIIKYQNCKQHNPDGSISNGGKLNTGASLIYNTIPSDRYYTSSDRNGYLLRLYGRILSKKK